jgi:alanyl-tRNA synthetase
MNMSSNELRKIFLKFFEERGHVIVPSSSLIPDDKSVLLTTAGMQQFKRYYTGELDPFTSIHKTLNRPLGSRNAASVQKSFRSSDIEEVGDESHLTFFEMLGNFSFGGYFKEEAIKWAWEFCHHILGIDISRVKISVFEGDSVVPADIESHQIWLKLGIPDGKIFTGSRKDNFWGPTGDEGPCGPTTEIYVDGIEIWNLVFNEFYQHPDGHLEPLKTKGVDTGMGLERLSLVIQYPEHPEHTVFSTDLFSPIMKLIPAEVNSERHRRIIADHIRAIAFLVADGVVPSNKEAGYVLRRLLRRVLTYGYLYKLKVSDFEKLLQKVVEDYGQFYSELKEAKHVISSCVGQEWEKFSKALSRGISKLERIDKIDNKIAFKLYESYGLPFEIIKELGGEKAQTLTREGFEEEFKSHQEISRVGMQKKFGGHGLEGISDEEARRDPIIWKMTRLHTATHLLHQALRNILGHSVKQMGSDINPERTRFDFTFERKLTQEELTKIEEEVNRKIKEDLEVKREIIPYEEAIKRGALAFFKEKYPDMVSVYTIGNYSMELCGGPHVKKTSEIGKFKIIKEESVSSGVRRIRAVVE